MQEELIFRIRAIAEGMEQATAKAASELRQLGAAYGGVDEKADQAQASVKDTNKSIGETAAVSAAAVLALRAILNVIRDSVTAFNEYRSALSGLQSVASGTGNSMATLTKMSDELTKDGLMTVSQVSAATKNLLLYGYTADQAADILERLKDSAAYNRQAHYSLGEAVKVTTEGIRMENSVLSDAAGVQKNIAKMYEEYAKSLGKSSDSLTQAEKAQAVYNGIMAETEIVAGNAARYSQEFAGQQAELEASTLRLKIAYGDATSGGLGPFVSMLSSGASALADFIENNRVLVSVMSTLLTLGISTVTMLGLKTAALKLLSWAATGSAASFTTLGTAIKGVWTSLGPLGWAVLGISALVTIISAVGSAAAESKKRAEELRQEIDSLAESNRGAGALVDEYAQLEAKGTAATADETQRMLDIRAELVKSYGFSAEAVDEEGRLLAGNLEIMKEQLALQKELLLAKLQEGETDTKNNLSDDQRDLEGYMRQLEAAQEKLKQLKEDLSRRGDQWEGALSGGWTTDAIANTEKGITELNQKIADTTASAGKGFADMLNLMVLELQQQGKKVPEALQTYVLDAMKAQFEAGIDPDTIDTNMNNLVQRYFDIDSEATASKVIPELQTLRDTIMMALADTEGVDTGTAATLVDTLLGGMTSESALAKALEVGEALRSKVQQGLASEGEMAQYDSASTTILKEIPNLQKQVNAQYGAGSSQAKALESVVAKLNATYKANATELRKAAVESKATASTYDSMRGEINSLAKEYGDVVEGINKIAQMKGAMNVLKTATKDSSKYADALAFLSEELGVSGDMIAENLPWYEAEIALKEQIALADYAMAAAAAASNIAVVNSMIANETVTKDAGAKMIDALQGVIDKFSELAQQSIEYKDQDGKTVASIKPTAYKRTGGGGGGGGRSGGGGGGTKKNTALERELALLEHKKALDQITAQEEIAWLERVLARYAKTTEEKRDLTEQLYAARKAKQEADLEYQRAMDQLTLREEIAHLTRMRDQYKKGTDARRKLEEQLYERKKELRRQEYDLAVYYGQKTLEQQAAWLKQEISRYEKGTQARIEMEKELYDVQQQIRDRDVDTINRLVEGITTALQNRYEAQRKIEEERIQQSIENWRKWGEEQVSAIEAQIEALDDLTKEEDRAEEERKKRRKIAALEQQLQYEQDTYNQKKLKEQLEAAQADLEKWLTRNEREDLKEALRDQIDAINEQVQAEEDKLNQQLEANNAYYDELTKAQNLQAEAQRLLMRSNQSEILKLLKSFAPDYNLTGQTLGEQMVAGFTSKVGNIEAWFDSLTAKVTAYQQQMAQVATAAADEYMRNHGVPTGAQTAQPTGPVQVSQPPAQITININQPVQSPTEFRREVERILAQLNYM